MICEKNCGFIACMDCKCDCFNKRSEILYPKTSGKHPNSIDFLMGNKNFVEQYTKKLKEIGLLK